MNGLDIVLINVISYLGGILSGLYIHHKMQKSKKCSKDNSDKKNVDEEYDVTQVYNSPVLASAIPNTIANAPPPMNPNYMNSNSNSNSSLQKRITITTE
tara:strand:+ start:1118 stop:1414 length:297 start_codon:yes stop_codon:yes gene_type:complete